MIMRVAVTRARRLKAASLELFPGPLQPAQERNHTISKHVLMQTSVTTNSQYQGSRRLVHSVQVLH